MPKTCHIGRLLHFVPDKIAGQKKESQCEVLRNSRRPNPSNTLRQNSIFYQRKHPFCRKKVEKNQIQIFCAKIQSLCIMGFFEQYLLFWRSVYLLWEPVSHGNISFALKNYPSRKISETGKRKSFFWKCLKEKRTLNQSCAQSGFSHREQRFL